MKAFTFIFAFISVCMLLMSMNGGGFWEVLETLLVVWAAYLVIVFSFWAAGIRVRG